MRPSFKLDENMPLAAVERLLAAGFDTSSIPIQKMSGAPDSRVAEVAAAEGRVVVTLDLDFADIRAYPPGTGPGFVILRPDHQDVPRVLDLIEVLIRAVSESDISGSLWIVEPDRVRVRTALPVNRAR